jgi:hypothetical protein
MVLCREASCSSSSLLPVASVYSRLWILFYGSSTERGLGKVGVPADNDFTYYSSKANPSSFSSYALISLSIIAVVGKLGEGVGRDYLLYYRHRWIYRAFS